ncbi:MAG: protein-methionine-sulfoxide reductase catalytic subunit MsrP [Paracoccaceae bacterium]
MIYHRREGWQISENSVTDEALYLNRRKVVAGMAGLGAAWTTLGMAPAEAALTAESAFSPRPELNPRFSDAGVPVTDENLTSLYNNFYEFGSSKQISKKAQALPTDPWTITIDGLVEKPFEIGVEDLLKKTGTEERIYRHRCVERWAMVIPWIGFPMRKLLEIANPLSSASHVKMETFFDPEVAPEQRARWYPWAYTEGVTIGEAANDLAFMVVGAYGKVLHKQFGAPIRMHLPWKYGFKSIKSIVRFTFVDEQPVGFWEELSRQEYGFWANVNPTVAHPRWPQDQQVYLGTKDWVPTELYNGYGEQVADIYKEMGDLHTYSLWR